MTEVPTVITTKNRCPERPTGRKQGYAGASKRSQTHSRTQRIGTRLFLEKCGKKVLKERDMSNRVQLLELFKKTATEIVEREFPNIAEATVISELGIDSLGMLEIVGAMERQLKIQIPDESLAGISTVQDLLELVEKRQSV